LQKSLQEEGVYETQNVDGKTDTLGEFIAVFLLRPTLSEENVRLDLYQSCLTGRKYRFSSASGVDGAKTPWYGAPPDNDAATKLLYVRSSRLSAT
jgi:hypothetical protein